MVRPFIENPFYPEEVQHLAESSKKIINTDEMTSATLIGAAPRKGGLDEVII